MTLVTATVVDVRGIPDNTVWVFHPLVLEAGVGDEITTTDYVRINPVDGELSVDLSPGFRAVAFRGKEYTIEVPETGPVDLFDLLAASIAFPPGTPPTMVAQAVLGYLATHPIPQSAVTDLIAALATKAPLASPAFTGTPTGITKAHVGLSNVDNTSNATERAATATLPNKTLASPIITGATVAPQGAELSLHNQEDQATNYERLLAKWDANNCEIKTNFGGSGATRTLRIGVAGVAGLETLSKWFEVKNSVPFFTTSGSTPTAGTYFQVAGTFSGTSGVQNAAGVNVTINQSGSAGYTGLQVNATESATGSGAKKLIDAQVGGTSKFAVDNTGVVTATASNTAGTALVRAGVPASATAAGVAGQIATAAGFIYVCTATNTWVRAALATW